MLVDFTHMNRTVTGIERLSNEMFGEERIRHLNPRYVYSNNILDLTLKQWFMIPFESYFTRSNIIYSGFPPSIISTILNKYRIIMYVHDMFLMTRIDDLNFRAKHYMRPSFIWAIRNLNNFLVNSEYTFNELRKYCRPDASIQLLRPQVRNVFEVSARVRPEYVRGNSLRLLAIGTIEPRKNYIFAAQIAVELSKMLNADVELNIVGRNGWGCNVDQLAAFANVKLLGYLDKSEIIELLAQSDMFISTSKDEGLGLPLLEAQFSGIPVAACDIPVFREVLGESGLFINAKCPKEAAARIVGNIHSPHFQATAAQSAACNLLRWNNLAKIDWEACQIFGSGLI